MLPETIEEDGRYRFKTARRDGLFVLMLVDADKMDGRSPVSPLWQLACRDEESRTAVSAWFTVRRSHWQDWGRLATAVGREAFAVHIAGLMEQQPPGFFQAMTVNPLPDERQVEFGMLLATDIKQRVEPLYVHTFGSPELRQHFFDWFENGENRLEAKNLVLVATRKGTLTLAAKLNEIAAEQAAHRSERKGD